MTLRWGGAMRVAGVSVAVALQIVTATVRAAEPPVEVWVEGVDRLPVEPVRDPTAASFVLEARDLERPGRTLADALATVPGVEVSRAGGGADLATASLRGATSAQTPIHLAGVRLNDDLTGTVDLSTLPMWVLRRVEIDRGSAPTSADRMGLGGAIFLEPEIPSRAAGRVSLGAGAFGQREVRGAVSFGSSRSAVLLAVRTDAARDDFEFLDDRGTRFDATDDLVVRRANSDHAGTDAWALARWGSGRSRVRAVAHALVRESGAPGLQLVPAREARANLARGLAGLSGEHDLERGSVEWALDGLVTRYHLQDPRRELGGALFTDNAGERTRQRVRVRRPVSDHLELAVGLAQELQHLRVAEDGASIVARRQLLHGDVEARYALGERGVVLAAVALDCHSTAASRPAEPCGILAPSARVGARATVAEGLAVFGNLGRYVREPTLGELYGISSALRGNEGLRPETGLGVDVGVTAVRRRRPIPGYVQLDAFARFSEDLVAFQRSSFGTVRPYNVGSARTLGAEFAAGGQLVGWIHGSVALTWLDPRDTTDERQVRNEWLPFRSRLVAAPALELRVPGFPSLGLDGARATLRYLHRAARTADPAGLIVLPRQDQLDVEVELALIRALAVRARLVNLLDQRMFDLLGYPLPGRAGYATVEARW
jgi:vitamin B12 transporter